MPWQIKPKLVFLSILEYNLRVLFILKAQISREWKRKSRIALHTLFIYLFIRH